MRAAARRCVAPAIAVGRTYGLRTVIAEEQRDGHGNRRVHWRCACGKEGVTALVNVMRSSACHGCPVLRKTKGPTAPERSKPSRPHIMAELAAMRDRAPELWLSDDPAAVQALGEVVSLLGPLTLDECGALLGVTRERVRQIEQRALQRALPRAKLLGVEVPEERRPTMWELAELHGYDESAA